MSPKELTLEDYLIARDALVEYISLKLTSLSDEEQDLEGIGQQLKVAEHIDDVLNDWDGDNTLSDHIKPSVEDNGYGRPEQIKALQDRLEAARQTRRG
jgi:hypothetical protein